LKNSGFIITLAIFLLVGSQGLAQEFLFPKIQPPQIDTLNSKKKSPKKPKVRFLKKSEISITSVHTDRKGINAISPILRYTALSGATSIFAGATPLKIQFSYVLGESQNPRPQLYFNVSIDNDLAKTKYKEESEKNLKEQRNRLANKYGKKESSLAIQMEKSGALGDLDQENIFPNNLESAVPIADTNSFKITTPKLKTSELPRKPEVEGPELPLQTPTLDTINTSRFQTQSTLIQKRDSISKSYPGREKEVNGMFSEIDSLKKNNPEFLKDIKSYRNTTNYTDSILNLKPRFNKPTPKLGTFYSDWSEHSIYQKAFSGLNYKLENVHTSVEFIFSANPFPGLARTKKYNKAALANLGFKSRFLVFSIKGGFVSNKENTTDTTFGKLRIYGVRSFDTYLIGSTQTIKINSRLEYQSEWNRVTSSETNLSSKQVFDGFFQNNQENIYNGDAIAQSLRFKSNRLDLHLGYSRVSPMYLNAGNPYLRFNWEKVTASIKLHSRNNKVFVEPRMELGRSLIQTEEPNFKRLFIAICTFGITEPNKGITGTISRPIVRTDSSGLEKAFQINAQAWSRNTFGHWIIQSILFGRSGNRNMMLDHTLKRVQSMCFGASAQLNREELALTTSIEYNADQVTSGNKLRAVNFRQVVQGPITRSVILTAFLQENLYLGSGYGTVGGVSVEKNLWQGLHVELGLKLASERIFQDVIPIRYSENQIFLKIIWKQ
jgi:hypothetical protein